MIRSSDIQYLYDPKEIAQILKPYPCLERCIAQYQQEECSNRGRSKYFPNARKSYREIYRVLGAQHYKHLQCLLCVLETCLAHNFKPEQLFKTDASKFDSSLSVLFAAHWFLKRGYIVTDCDDTRGQLRIFDLTASKFNNNFLVEVYSPRVWEGWSDFNEELRLALLHLDCPYDFSYALHINLGQPDFERSILHFDPWDFSEAMETPECRAAIISNIRKTVLDTLGTSASPFAFDTDVPGKRTTTSINLKVHNIVPAHGRLPHRFGALLNSLSGYAPEGMFDHILQHNILGKKLQRRQLPSQRPQGKTRVLLIDVTRLKFLTDEPQHPVYRKYFLDSVERHILEEIGAERKVDLVIFAKMSLVPQFFFCAAGACAESEITAFVGEDRQVEVLRRCSEFVIMGEIA